MKRILCVWFPNWPIQRLVVDQPELRCQRIVLFRRDARRGQIVSAVSPLAMQDGLAIDMPLSEAKSLLRRATQVASGAKSNTTSQTDTPFFIFEHEQPADMAALETLADQLESFSPIVGLEAVDPIEFKRGRRADSVFLDITGLAHLFGDEEQLATRLMLSLERSGHLPRVAVAGTVGSAWAFARYFAGPHFRQFQQPLLVDDRDEDSLGQLPVRSLRLENTITDTLYQLGIETLGQLKQIPRNDLAMRFGDVIHRRLDQLTGVLDEPVVARHKPSEFMDEQLLEYPTHHRETMEVIIARLAGELCRQMRSRQQGSLEWTIRLICQAGDPIEFKVNLFQPTSTVDHIMPLIEMQLEQALSPVTRKVRRKRRAFGTRAKKRSIGSTAAGTTKPIKPQPEMATRPVMPQPTATQTGSPTVTSDANVEAIGADLRLDPEFHRYTTIEVCEIRVTVSSYVLLAPQQRKLFDESPQLDRQTLSHLINRLASRLGTHNVVYPTLQSGAQPEYSYLLKPLVDARRRTHRKIAKAKSRSHTLARPLRLFRPPIPLVTLMVAPEVTNRAANATSAVARSSTESAPVSLRAPTPCLAILALAKEYLSSDATQPRAFERFGSQVVVASNGPERIETGWWRGRTVCRDYWRVETETGQHFWIYRDRRTTRWWLHGEF